MKTIVLEARLRLEEPKGVLDFKEVVVDSVAQVGNRRTVVVIIDTYVIC